MQLQYWRVVAAALVSQAIQIPFRNRNAQVVILEFVCLFVCFVLPIPESRRKLEYDVRARSVELREQSFHY